MLEDSKKEEILNAAKKWFADIVAPNHIKNTEKLVDPQEFNINPFLAKYLARFLTGKSDAISIAKALVYPRILGTSINTSFGTNAQKFISGVLGSFGSAIPGIDIEFFDQIDNRKKYCQVKLGPNNINHDDVETINHHFSKVRNLAKTNNLKSLEYNDLVIGILYGEAKQLNGSYKKLEKKYHYPIYVGKEFWLHLTGSEIFYYELSTAISKIASKYDSSHLLEEIILKLAQSPNIKEIAD